MYKISGEIIMEIWSFLKVLENMLSLFIIITSMLNSSYVSFKYSCSEIQSSSIKRLYFRYPYNLEFEEENGKHLCQGAMYSNWSLGTSKSQPATGNDFTLRSRIFTDFAILNYSLAFVFLVFYLKLKRLSKFLRIVLVIDISIHVLITALWICFCLFWTVTSLAIMKATSARYLIHVLYREDCLRLKNCSQHEPARYDFLYASLAFSYINLVAWGCNTLILIRMKRAGNSSTQVVGTGAAQIAGTGAAPEIDTTGEPSTDPRTDAGTEETEILF